MPPIMVWLVVVITAACVVMPQSRRVTVARRTAESRARQLNEVTRLIDEVNLLRSTAEGGLSALDSAAEAESGGIAPRITAALQAAGLSAAILTSVSPEAQSPVARSGSMQSTRRRITLTLAGLTLPQFGKFLDAWRAAEPRWTPASIDTSATGGVPPASAPVTPGGDLPLRVVMTVERLAISARGDDR